MMFSVPVQMEQALAEQTKRAYAMSLLAFSKTKNPIEALLQNYSARNAALEVFTEGMDKTSVGCSKGCASCCHQMVACSPFEVFWIARTILDSTARDDVQSLRAKLKQLSSRPKEAVARFGSPCPLLNASVCSIYKFRPLACRTTYSKSRKQCEDALVRNGGQIHYPAEPIVIGQAMDLGLSCAIWRVLKLDLRSVELCGALNHAIADFDVALSQWLSGESPFEDHALSFKSEERSASYLDALVSILDKTSSEK